MRGLAEKLFSFMNKFVFEADKSSLAIVGQYARLDELVQVTML